MKTKREPEKTLMDQYLEDPEFAKLMAQGDLIMEVTETLCELLEKEKVSRKELAGRLGKSKGFVSQLLNGGRNLTLRTVADILRVLGYKISLKPYKEAWQRQQCEFEPVIWHSQTSKPNLVWKHKEFSVPENYLFDHAA
jgi:transcriptional regulator with XRE-family HTH domain